MTSYTHAPTPAARPSPSAAKLTARRVVDRLTESFLEGLAAIAGVRAIRRALGRHRAFCRRARSNIDPRNSSGSQPAGGRGGRPSRFDTVEAKDWVKATLEELVPVGAGRFHRAWPT